MKKRNLIQLVLLIVLLLLSCNTNNKTEIGSTADKRLNLEIEKQAIIDRLNNETKNAFERDYEAWTQNWVHDPSISKVYLNFADSTFSESVGWKEISQFVKTFIEEHPDPESVPNLLKNIDVRLYGQGAWVNYEQRDSIRGLKRETRLMEKVNGVWKIAGMQTTIYGFDSNEKQ